MATHKCMCGCAQASTSPHSKSCTHFAHFMDHHTGTRVFMVHFLAESRKRTWTDGCVYMQQDSRAVQTATKTSSSMTTEGSLHKTKFLPP